MLNFKLSHHVWTVILGQNRHPFSHKFHLNLRTWGLLNEFFSHMALSLYFNRVDFCPISQRAIIKPNHMPFVRSHKTDLIELDFVQQGGIDSRFSLHLLYPCRDVGQMKIMLAWLLNRHLWRFPIFEFGEFWLQIVKEGAWLWLFALKFFDYLDRGGVVPGLLFVVDKFFKVVESSVNAGFILRKVIDLLAHFFWHVLTLTNYALYDVRSLCHFLRSC